MKSGKHELIIHININPYPQQHEIHAAAMLAEYFDCDVQFIQRKINAKTLDLLIKGIRWEIKSPKGNAKNTIDNNLRKANRQSQYVVIDLSRTKMRAYQAKARINAFLREGSTKFKRILLINKSGKVLEIL
ncbi:MAG: hypothetical protein LBL67_00885 [Coriobacteriales bacterium]|jgi:hypothetical protein|nr:hypothetical protein [Coriobacteriales bacterium]